VSNEAGFVFVKITKNSTTALLLSALSSTAPSITPKHCLENIEMMNFKSFSQARYYSTKFDIPPRRESA
jgi:hypothetical protein